MSATSTTSAGPTMTQRPSSWRKPVPRMTPASTPTASPAAHRAFKTVPLLSSWTQRSEPPLPSNWSEKLEQIASDDEKRPSNRPTVVRGVTVSSMKTLRTRDSARTLVASEESFATGSGGRRGGTVYPDDFVIKPPTSQDRATQGTSRRRSRRSGELPQSYRPPTPPVSVRSEPPPRTASPSEADSSQADPAGDEEDLAPYWSNRRWSAWLLDQTDPYDAQQAMGSRPRTSSHGGRPGAVLSAVVGQSPLRRWLARWLCCVRTCMCVRGGYDSRAAA